MTRLERTWHLLRWYGTMHPRDLALWVHCTPHYTAKMLRRLAERGSAKVTGASWSRRYTATRKCPSDLRGKHPQIAINFAKGRVLGNQVQAARRGRLLVPRLKHPLDIAMRRPHGHDAGR